MVLWCLCYNKHVAYLRLKLHLFIGCNLHLLCQEVYNALFTQKILLFIYIYSVIGIYLLQYRPNKRNLIGISNHRLSRGLKKVIGKEVFCQGTDNTDIATT